VLYPLLTRLERDGLVVKRVAQQTGRPERHLLDLTALGQGEFESWLTGAADEDDEVTYDFFIGQPFLAKCMFFDRLPAARVKEKLLAQKEVAKRKQAEFERIRAGMRERGAPAYRIAILELGLAQQRAKVRWLDGLLRGRNR
jgi:DNA-binding PadR family transcriptional regulator